MASPFYFDEGRADRAVEFFSKFIRLVSAEWAGKPFVLEKWQANIIRQIFGWRRRSDGTRRYRRVRIWVPRKNGKTELMAGIGHLLTVGDGEQTAEVYSHALDKSQASIVFDKAVRMVELSEQLADLYEVTKKGLFCPQLMALFQPLSGEAAGKHGLSPHAILGDEAHEWKDDRLHHFLIQGMAARRQPMDIIISTAGEIKTYGHELYLDSRAILEDPSLDPECFVAIFEADPEDDWTDPKVWAKANPNLGVSVKREFLESLCKKAQQNPRFENDFKRYHLNIWVEQDTRWLPMRMWDKNTAYPKDQDLWKKLPAMMKGRRGYAALDLGSTRDITGKIWLFPPEDDNGRFVLVPEFWVPHDTIEQRDSPRTPYARWVRIGALKSTPGNVTDYDFIEEEVRRDIDDREFQFANSEAGLAYDRWNATQVLVHLQKDGVPGVPFGQGFASMSAPSKELERLFVSGRFEHGNHPVLRWMFGNAVIAKDPAGNIKPDKARAAEMIEGVITTAMAIGLWQNDAEEGDINDFLRNPVMVV